MSMTSRSTWNVFHERFQVSLKDVEVQGYEISVFLDVNSELQIFCLNENLQSM